ncbi:Cut8 six-helix bundle-domain-containing protein [Lipomyces orientalis]|uniref:Cut8 six-helix bundle-domain-containing protein n=1 Tax=Lipomyces orientalis TaxID=1233043 RepID=A0ACC3U191_9ASCO
MSAVLPPTGPLLGFPFSGQSKEASPGPTAPTVQSPILSPSFSYGQKRKLSHDDDSDDEMVGSPDSSHALAARNLAPLPQQHHNAVHSGFLSSPQPAVHHHNASKRARTEIIGRPLPLSRQLESLDARALKAIICSLADKHAYLVDEISSMAPTPTVTSSLELLSRHLDRISSAFPYKGDPAGDYAYIRVRPHVAEFLDAVSDYTPHFLPPREQQVGNCLQFLDGVTSLVHRLPEWRADANNALKHAAYDELSRAWSLVVREALKRANGIVLEYGGWRDKIAKHNESAGGRLQSAVDAVDQGLGNAGRRFGRFF